MQDNHIRYNDIITEKLAWLVTTVNLDKKLNLMNRAVLAENFYVEFLSALTDWKLENANKKYQNEPGIDLVSNDPNILALAEELLQENKPKCERDFSLALDKYMSASKLDRAASLYSASKAAQLLTQKKAGINEKGEACFIEQANEEKTIATAVSMMELAALDRKYWCNNHYFKGELLTNYCHNGERYLNSQEAKQAAFNEYNLAASMMKERNMPVIIGLIRQSSWCNYIENYYQKRETML